MYDRGHPELYCIISADIYYFNTGLELGLNEKKKSINTSINTSKVKQILVVNHFTNLL